MGRAFCFLKSLAEFRRPQSAIFLKKAACQTIRKNLMRNNAEIT